MSRRYSAGFVSRLWPGGRAIGYSTAGEMASELSEILKSFSTDHSFIGPSVASGRPVDSPFLPSTRGSHPTSTIRDQDLTGSRELTIVPRGLYPYEAQDAGFFPMMLPGPRGNRGLPECLEFWRSRIVGHSRDDCFRVGVLFGPAGCGKTSLIRAGVLPLLPECISVVYLEATAHGTRDCLAGDHAETGRR